MRTNDQEPNRDIKIRLRTKFLIIILSLEAMLMLAIILMVEQQMRESILHEFSKRGLSVTQGLAAVNRDFVTTYNYVKIDQSLDRIVEENNLLYATFILFDGEVIGYKGQQQFKNKVLQGSLYENTFKIDDSLIQYGKFDSKEFCDIAVPIFLSGEYWGTMRTGFSLDDIQLAIDRMRQVFLIIGFVGLVCTYLASVFLARRITRPINNLVSSVQAIGDGDYDHPIEISTHDEVGYLGRRFMIMRERLKDQLREIEWEVAEVQRKEEQIRHLAYHDAVTGLPNRMFLKEYLSQALQQAGRYRRTLAVLFLDLDRFKWINDTLGHDAGDELLCEVARRLSRCVRGSDCVAWGTLNSGEDSLTWERNTVVRLGGDEFVVLLTDIRNLEDAALVARRINQELSKSIDLGGNQVRVTTSIGISGYPKDGDDVDTLLKHADAAMYHAKSKGKNCYQFFDGSLNAHFHQDPFLENELPQALVNDANF